MVADACFAQVDSSSEDAADDNDSDFELGRGGTKRKAAAKAPGTTQPLKNKPGNAAEATSFSFRYSKYVVNPKDISQDVKQFLERAGVSWSTYTDFMPEIRVSHSGNMVMNEECFSLSRNARKQSTVPNEWTWADIQCMKSNKGSDAERVICFQTVDGLVHTMTIDGLAGDYSRFRM